MGYAHGYLLADYVELAYQEMTTAFAAYWPYIRTKVSGWTFKPDSCEQEFQGVLDGVRALYPTTTMDIIDVKAACTYGDWAYAFACRSTSCWDEWVESPYTTLSVRKLQFSQLPAQMTQQWHHVICAWQPEDGSPAWVNFGFPGYVSAVTAVNEYGTISSLHDWYSSTGPDYAAALPRTMACRYAATMPLSADPTTHLQTVFDELGNYDVATGGFINYYVPDGGGGVIKTAKSSGFYEVRLPQLEWMNGHVVSTNNTDIDGRNGISPWVTYYNTLDPGAGRRATMQGLWDTAYQYTDMHIVEVGFRGTEDMILWFTGRLQSVNLPRLEFEWDELFCDPSAVEYEVGAEILDGRTIIEALAPFPNPASGRLGMEGITIRFTTHSAAGSPRLAMCDPSGRCVRILTPALSAAQSVEAHGDQLVYRWDGNDRAGESLPAGVYSYRLLDELAEASRAGSLRATCGRVVWLGR